MSTPFLICAMPRSRSAWIANWLNSGNISCGHELSSIAPTPGEMGDLLLLDEKPFAGNSDTYQAMQIDALLDEMPGVKIVTVSRPIEQAAESLRQVGIPTEAEDLLPAQKAIERISKMPGVLPINFTDLNAEACGRAILQHVAPGETFDVNRWRFLQNLDIQVTPRRIVELMRLAERNAVNF